MKELFSIVVDTKFVPRQKNDSRKMVHVEFSQLLKF